MNKSKNKGDRFERAVVNKHIENGFECERTLESGARSNSPVTWDINLHIGVPTKTLKGECKARKDGFKQLYEWIENRDFLVVKANNKKPLYVISEEFWLELLRGQE